MKGLLSALLLVIVGAALASLPVGEARQQGGQQQQDQKQDQKQGATINVEVPVVTLEVIATTQHGDLLTGLKKENFRVTDDGAVQAITNFGTGDAPITIVMLMEFSSRGYDVFAYMAKYWADAFFPNLRQQDWVALVTFDLKPHMEVDFTQDKEEVRNAVYHLMYPGFAESNVFDSLLDTIDRLKTVKGKKSVLLLATGVDTFSKRTFDQTMKQLRQSDVTVFCVGLDKPYTNWLDTHGRMGSHMDYLQGENQMRTFAQLTGGLSWFPQFEGEIPGMFRDLTAYLRNQYSLSYTPTTGAKDGKFHKVKVELVEPDGSPLTVENQKHKKQKTVVYAREGYEATKSDVGGN
jgi:VWFA-related protein